MMLCNTPGVQEDTQELVFTKGVAVDTFDFELELFDQVLLGQVELKPCPHCGSDVELTIAGIDDNGDPFNNKNIYRIDCKECERHHDSASLSMDTKYRGLQGLVDWWNTRI